MCIRLLGLEVVIGLLEHGIFDFLIFVSGHCCFASVLVDVGHSLVSGKITASRR